MKGATSFDAVVIGAGIVGLATAQRFSQLTGLRRIAILDREAAVAQHQTGHNSGVIHAGVYYKPGSLKARLCRAGLIDTKNFCREHGLPMIECGKLVVALDDIELERLQQLALQSRQNGAEIAELTQHELRAEEPAVAGLGALLVRETGITSYAQIANRLAQLLTAAGSQIFFGEKVISIQETARSVQVRSRTRTWNAPLLVACAGLWSDRVLASAGHRPNYRIVPFRGAYYGLRPRDPPYSRRLIYPVPDPATPFLGVHLTRMIGEHFTVGPNASLCLARDGYQMTRVNFRDVASMMGFSGFWKMLARHRRAAIGEMASALSKERFLRLVCRYYPKLTAEDLQPYPAGVRAQAVGSDGRLIEDFHFVETECSLHVCNAPSPAATSAFPIGAHIAELAARKL